MSMHIGFAPRALAPRSLPGLGLRANARMLLARAGTALRRWVRVASTRRDLMEVDDRMLSDLGISRAQANFELSRKFWN